MYHVISHCLFRALNKSNHSVLPSTYPFYLPLYLERSRCTFAGCECEWVSSESDYDRTSGSDSGVERGSEENVDLDLDLDLGGKRLEVVTGRLSELLRNEEISLAATHHHKEELKKEEEIFEEAIRKSTESMLEERNDLSASESTIKEDLEDIIPAPVQFKDKQIEVAVLEFKAEIEEEPDSSSPVSEDKENEEDDVMSCSVEEPVLKFAPDVPSRSLKPQPSPPIKEPVPAPPTPQPLKEHQSSILPTLKMLRKLPQLDEPILQTPKTSKTSQQIKQVTSANSRSKLSFKKAEIIPIPKTNLFVYQGNIVSLQTMIDKLHSATPQDTIIKSVLVSTPPPTFPIPRKQVTEKGINRSKSPVLPHQYFVQGRASLPAAIRNITSYDRNSTKEKLAKTAGNTSQFSHMTSNGIAGNGFVNPSPSNRAAVPINRVSPSNRSPPSNGPPPSNHSPPVNNYSLPSNWSPSNPEAIRPLPSNNHWSSTSSDNTSSDSEEELKELEGLLKDLDIGCKYHIF